MLPQVDWNSPREMGRNPPFFPVGTQWETRGKNRRQGLGTKGFAQKKVLSLVLCVAMLLSVMVMGTGAAFTDEDDFSPQYAEAAEVLTNLKVMQGYDDSSFLPQRNITRAQVATLIYRAATGDVTDSQTDIYSDYDKFDDVQSTDWFAGYVNYCGNAELIKGFTPTTFGPNKNVTGYQVLAMILRAVGYDQNDEFTGPGWEVRTASTAESLGILDNVQDATLGQPATRELVAELIFRAMIVPTVEYTNAFGYQQNKTTLGWNEFKLFEAEGTIVANQMADLAKAGTSLDDGKTAIVNNFGHRDTYNLTTDTSIIGEKVNVWIADDTAVSTPVSLADVTDWSNIVLDKDQIQEIKDATNRYTDVYNNYVAVAQNAYDSGKGVMVKAIDNNGDGDYEYILTETETLAVVKSVNTDGKVVLDTVNSEKTQVAYDGIAEGDVVLTNTFGGKTYIEEAAYVTGNISSYVQSESEASTATINGTAYEVSDIGYGVKSDATHPFNSVKDTFAHEYNGKVYNYYQDAYGNIRAWALASENEVGYGLVLSYDQYKTGAYADEWYVKYLTVDNTVETKVVDEDSAWWKGEVGTVVQYRVNDNDEFVPVYTIDDADTNDIITTNSDSMKAYIGQSSVAETSRDTYNITSDFIAFYYEAGHVGYAATYGVLTGDAAIADVDNGGQGKSVAQYDAVSGVDTHTNRYETLTVVNIDGMISADEQYCYIFTDTHSASFNTEDGLLYTYKAVNENGEAIDVVAGRWLYNNDNPVWNYVTAMIDVVRPNGTTDTVEVYWVNDVAPANLGYGDLHADQSSTNVFRYYGIADSMGIQLEAPAVYADATSTAGGTVDLNATYCSSGYVVYNNDNEALAVFVTEAADNDYDFVDITYNEKDYHLEIGTEYTASACIDANLDKNLDGLADIHAGDKVTVDRSWGGMVAKDVNPCYVCNPHEDFRTNVIAEIGQPSKSIVCLQDLTGYTTKEAALSNRNPIDLKGATWLNIATDNGKLDVQYAIYTSSTDALNGNDTQFSSVNTDINCETLISNGVLLLKVTANDGSGVALDCDYCSPAEAVYVAIQLPTT